MDTDPVAEGFARVVAVADGVAWLEPESPPACGGCAAKAGCGTTYLRPRESRRFALADDFAARPGELVVVGMRQSSLTRATMVAYMIPVVALIGAAIIAALLGAGDGGTAAAALMGLVGGIALARVAAARLSAMGELSPVFLRRAGESAGSCSDRAEG